MSADTERFWQLIRRYEEHPAEREGILQEVGERFQKPVAILVVDTCGFTRSVREQGIVPFLVLLERLERVVNPLVERCGGRLFPRAADNFFAIFDGPRQALDCGALILRGVAALNEGLPLPERMAVSIGVGYGEVLVVGPDLLYGDEMNLVCKIGEDLADDQELLLTPAAASALGDELGEAEERHFFISGVEIVAYRPDGILG
ncbi:MAG TPA: adenylate/guanylate cyclase domain-containing protein [Actinomycetota bacterium]